MNDRPDLTDEAHLARAEGLIATEMDGETVILDVESGLFFHLNATGSRVWSLLDAPMTFGDLCAAMRERFAVDADECRRDVGEFAQGMIGHGLLRRTQS